MPCRLSMPNLLAALFLSAAPGLCAGVGVTSIRQPGALLDTSMQNEVEHAVDLASTWLAARQNADGSWGSETARVERTAITLLALLPRKARYSDACARAAVWVDNHAPSADDNADAHAWRVIALLSAAPDTPARSNLTQRLLREALPHAPGTNTHPLIPRLLWNDALALSGQRVAPARDSRGDFALKSAATQWPQIGTSPYCLWLTTFLINRAANGALERDGRPLDWRRDVAQILINSQRRDPAGGYWGPTEGDSQIRQTAFGILTLVEL